MIYDEKTSCADVLKAWDAGESVWSVEMGGLGPGYEQAIQVLAMECLRELVAKDFQWSPGAEGDSDRCRALLDPVVSVVNEWPGMGFSGAQVGAAMQIASKLHFQGPRVALDSAPQDRKIQISRSFPSYPEEDLRALPDYRRNS